MKKLILVGFVITLICAGIALAGSLDSSDRRIADKHFRTFMSSIIDGKRDDAFSILMKGVEKSAYYHMNEDEQTEAFVSLREPIIAFLKEPNVLYTAEIEENETKVFIYQFRQGNTVGVRSMEFKVGVDSESRVPRFTAIARILTMGETPPPSGGGIIPSADSGLKAWSRVIPSSYAWEKMDFLSTEGTVDSIPAGQ